MNYLPGLVLNHDPLELRLSSRYDYSCEPSAPDHLELLLYQSLCWTLNEHSLISASGQPWLRFCFVFPSVLGFELRAYTWSHSTSPFL
jgi:hypothetical protein